VSKPIEPTRRQFIKTSAVVGGALAIGNSISSVAYAQASDEIKVALIGCGGRGTGAVAQMFNTPGNVKLVAIADALESSTTRAIQSLTQAAGDQAGTKMALNQGGVFVGLDAYKAAIDTDCDLVAIATPPGFKPQQFEYAVSRGKHIFCEKPVAVDAAGIRRFLAAVEESKRKNLMVGIGLQRRHEGHYKNMMDRIHNGAIGDIINMRVYWNGGGIWFRNDEDNRTQMQNQCNNWYHYIWSCGDQICEQHIHNLDVGCWAKNMYPVEANGMGGWGRRLEGDGRDSQIYDHTFIEYTFPDGSTMHSQGRHLQNSFTRVGEFAHGTLGNAYFPNVLEIGGNRERIEGAGGGHQQEQTDLIAALTAGQIYNEGEYGAKSTFTAILGREACYSGKIVTWDDLLANGKDYCINDEGIGIDDWNVNTTPPAVRDENGIYNIPKPGIHNPNAPVVRGA